ASRATGDSRSSSGSTAVDGATPAGGSDNTDPSAPGPDAPSGSADAGSQTITGSDGAPGVVVSSSGGAHTATTTHDDAKDSTEVAEPAAGDEQAGGADGDTRATRGDDQKPTATAVSGKGQSGERSVTAASVDRVESSTAVSPGARARSSAIEERSASTVEERSAGAAAVLSMPATVAYARASVDPVTLSNPAVAAVPAAAVVPVPPAATGQALADSVV